MLTRRILLVDDDEGDGLFYLYKTLARDGGGQDLIFDEAKDGEEALSLFEENRYDIILSDWEMPKMDGIQLLEAIAPRLNSTDFYIVTGGNDEKTIRTLREKVLALGGKDVWDKPSGVLQNLSLVCQEKYSQDKPQA
jgi:two-component system chemotaxis response regulator CheY